MSLFKRLFGRRDDPTPTREPAPAPEFPYPLDMVTGYAALDLLSERREAAAGTATVVLVGGVDSIDGLRESHGFSDATPEEIIAAADGVDPVAWLAQRRELDPECYEAEVGAWPDALTPTRTLTAHVDLASGKRLPHVGLTRLPTPRPADAAAYLRFGDWNECPAPEHHVAMARYWLEHYAAEPVAFTTDTIEFAVARPPTERDAALRLAEQQYVYCPDIVDQGAETLSALAATLVSAPYWYFWWD